MGSGAAAAVEEVGLEVVVLVAEVVVEADWVEEGGLEEADWAEGVQEA